jgi:hypothetical protein
MADLRVIALGALVACGSATAQPDPVAPVTPPAGWQRLPAAATAARSAAGAPGIAVEQIEAWGESTTGCYALWFALRGGSSGADAIAKEIVEGLATEKFAVSDSAVTDGVFELAIERTPYKGRLRAQVGDGKVTGLACVANQRDPASCDAPCKTMLGAIK